MSDHLDARDIRPKILYQVAKAAWEGTLLERREEICHLIYHEFQDTVTRQYIANQIRIAMGLNPHDSERVLDEYDEETLMGLSDEPVVVTNPSACRSCPNKGANCEKACALGAIGRDAEGNISIDRQKCLEEGHCIAACTSGALAQKSQFVPLIEMLRERTHPVYASIAPAFVGQFGPEVTPGKLRSSLLKLGFTDMVETALYADLITLKEAFEFDNHVKAATDFMLTSCCCPVWIKLIENKFPALVEHISPSVSPMIASARIIKNFEPNAKVIFIGPCVAKKSEAMLPDLKGAIDFVLTFQEIAALFEAAKIDPVQQPDEEKPIASWAGRVYAYTGGVSAAVAATLGKIRPNSVKKLVPIQIDGIPDCQKILEQLQAGRLTANFIEGMACKGGCVGGPGRLVAPEKGKQYVANYGNVAKNHTPVENPQVYTILTRLGHDDANHSLLAGESPIANLLSRKLK